MMHPSDSELVLNLLNLSEVPKEIEDEYEIWRRLYHGGGASGALRIQMLVPLLRQLGYAPPVVPKPEGIEWRDHIGKQVVAQYGDQDVLGVLVGFGPHGTLVLKLDGYPGETELPKYQVRLDL